MKNTKREWEKIATDARKGLIVHHGLDFSDDELVTMTTATFDEKCDEAYERGLQAGITHNKDWELRNQIDSEVVG